MTLAEAGEIFRYWEANPPPYLILQAIARLMGWQPPASSPAQPAARETAPEAVLSDLAAMRPPGLAVMQAGQIAMPPPVLDPAALRARNTTRIRSGNKGSADDVERPGGRGSG
jgi:hypothetical protein